ncbi:MAG: DUF7793 family protein [Bacteroidia bacterium]
MNTTTKEIALRNAQVKLREDGIVQINIADNASISLKEMKEIVAAIKKVSKGVLHPVLKVCGKYSEVEDEALTYLTKDIEKRYATAEALVCHSLAQKITMSFFIKKDKNATTLTRLFTDVNEAEKWLKEL